MGISDGEQERLFERFYRTRAGADGCGSGRRPRPLDREGDRRGARRHDLVRERRGSRNDVRRRAATRSTPARSRLTNRTTIPPRMTQRLRSGAELRVTGPADATARRRLRQRRPGQRGARARGAPRSSGSSRRLAPRFPAARLRRGAVPHQVVEAARLVRRGRTRGDRRASARERTLLLGFSMGGAVAIAAAGRARRSRRCSASRPGFPDRLALEPLRGRRLRVLHGSLDRWLPGIPGVSPASSRRGFERARALGVEGDYTLIPRRRPRRRAARALGPCRCRSPRAGTWARLVADELALLSGRGLKPRAALELRRVRHLHVPDEPSRSSAADHPPRDVDLPPRRGRAAPRPGTRGGCCASPRRRRAARRASCCAPRRASGSPAARTCGRSSSR